MKRKWGKSFSSPRDLIKGEWCILWFGVDRRSGCLVQMCCLSTGGSCASLAAGQHYLLFHTTPTPRGKTSLRRLEPSSDRTSRCVDELLSVVSCLSCSLMSSLLQITDPESIKRCIEECEARIEIGVHLTSNTYCNRTVIVIK